MDGLVDYYRRISGEHPDWDEYRRAMQQRRVLLRVSIDKVGPSRADSEPRYGLHAPRDHSHGRTRAWSSTARS